MDEYMRQHLLDEIERKRKGFFRIWFQIIERSAIISLLHPPKEKNPKKKKRKKKNLTPLLRSWYQHFILNQIFIQIPVHRQPLDERG